MKKKNKEFNVTAGFIILSCITMVYDLMFREGIKFLRILLLIGTILVMYIFYKKSFLKKYKTMYYIGIGFVFIGMYLANIWGFYAIPYYDKVLHLISGAIIALIGYLLFMYLFNEDAQKHMNKLAPLIFCIIFSIAIAGVWEMWEFTTDYLFGLKAQNNSLIDTMWDIICGTVVGTIISIFIYINSRGKRITFIQRIIDEANDNK